MNPHILEPEVQEYIRVNQKANPQDIALKKSPFPMVTNVELATQVDGLQRCIHKLPLWATTLKIYFPPKLNLEQCSSEKTAQFKLKLISPNSKTIDLTGGFGVDSYYFSTKVNSHIYCELNETLSEIVAHNLNVLQIDNVEVISGDSVAYLASLPDHYLDYIYIDPSRRVNQQKVFLLSDCEPNVVKLQTDFFKKSNTIITKAAPLMDIKAALAELSNVKAVYIVSLNNDCKELLFVQEKEYQGAVTIIGVALKGDTEHIFEGSYEEEQSIISDFSLPQTYLYEPDVSINKAGFFKLVGNRFSLKKLQVHTHLYTSEELVHNFIGRTFKIKSTYTLPEFKKIAKGMQANVATKNFPMKPEEIKQKYKIKDGGNQYLFFCKDLNENMMVIVCEKL